MSDPVSPKDDDEVLSSVRRSVTDARPDEEYDVTSSGSERLVLTPQLRVDAASVLHLKPQYARAARNKDSAAEEAGERLESSQKPAMGATTARTNVAAHYSPPLSGLPQQPPFAHPAPDANSDVFELSAKIAAFETAIGRIPDQWEPDGTGTDAYAGTSLPAMSWPDLESLNDGADRQTGVPRPDPQAVDADKPLSIGGQRIDEEALRDLVAEIVRAELKGPLGERITRNVRTLVRREIQNALAAQSLKKS